MAIRAPNLIHPLKDTKNGPCPTFIGQGEPHSQLFIYESFTNNILGQENLDAAGYFNFYLNLNSRPAGSKISISARCELNGEISAWLPNREIFL